MATKDKKKTSIPNYLQAQLLIRASQATSKHNDREFTFFMD